MTYRYFIVLIADLFVSSFAGEAQQIPDTSFREKALSNLVKYYHAAIGFQAGLYNGPQYDAYPRPFTEGHQFFRTDTFEKGSVVYDGLQYLDVPLKLDIIRDELIMLHPVSGFDINLIKEKIDSFSVAGHSFINIMTNRSDSALKAGFYDQIFSSSALKLLVKRKKYIQERNERASIELLIYGTASYFIQKNGLYYSVRNKKSIINLLKDKRNEIQKFIKANKLKFRKDFEEDAIRTVRYYDQLQ